MENNFELRMYGLVPYNLSPIQQGIQFGHGVVEYLLDNNDKDCSRWANEDKTFIILNGGTTNLGLGNQDKGTLNKALHELVEAGITVSTFYERDLGDQLTSINFLVDERVFDKKEYPDFNPGYISDPFVAVEEHGRWVKSIGGPKNKFLREFLKKYRLA